MKSLMVDEETHKRFKDHCKKNRLIQMKELKHIIDSFLNKKINKK